MILEEMFNGRFYPCETVVADSSRFKQAVKASAALMDTLSERLSKEDYALVKNCGSRWQSLNVRKTKATSNTAFRRGCLSSRKPMRRCRRKTKNSIFNSGCSQTGNNHHNRILLHKSHLPINRRMAFLPLPDMEILLPLTSGLAVGRDGAGLSSHIVGAFELLGQAQYPQKCREVL